MFENNNTDINRELFDLVREIYDWTNYKNTRWALRAARVIDEIETKKLAIDCVKTSTRTYKDKEDVGFYIEEFELDRI